MCVYCLLEVLCNLDGCLKVLLCVYLVVFFLMTTWQPSLQYQLLNLYQICTCERHCHLN